MNYIISEELRDRLIDNLEANAMADGYASSCRDQADKLRNLTPVQSGGVVTRETIAKTIIEARMPKIAWEYETQDSEALCINALAENIYSLQLPAPTSQPEAREYDLSGVKTALEKVQSVMSVSFLKMTAGAWADLFIAVKEAIATLNAPTPQPEARGVDFESMKKVLDGWHGPEGSKIMIPAFALDHLAKTILANLQQAPQGDSINLGGKQIEDANLKILERSFQQLERQAPQGVDFMGLPGVITAYFPFDALCRANGITSNYEKTAIAQAAVHAISKHLAHLQQSQQGVGEWIPVTERLPDNGVILTFYHGFVEVVDTRRGLYTSEKRNPFFPNDQWDGSFVEGFAEWGGRTVRFTHWQPLPSAPVKVDDINPGDILCEKCNQPAIWCECPKTHTKVDDHE